MQESTSLWWLWQSREVALGVDGLCSDCIMHPLHVRLFCSESWQDPAPLPTTLSFFTFNPLMHTFLSFFLQFLENQVLTSVNKHSTWTFPFKALRYLFQNCKYWIKILSTLTFKSTWIIESNNSSVSWNKIQSSWSTVQSVQGTKKLVIMRYHLSAISL